MRDQVHAQPPAVTALEARARLVELEAERMAALEAGLGDVQCYMTELERDRERWLHHYTMAVVTDIATVVGGLFGRQQG